MGDDHVPARAGPDRHRALPARRDGGRLRARPAVLAGLRPYGLVLVRGAVLTDGHGGTRALPSPRARPARRTRRSRRSRHVRRSHRRGETSGTPGTQPRRDTRDHGRTRHHDYVDHEPGLSEERFRGFARRSHRAQEAVGRALPRRLPPHKGGARRTRCGGAVPQRDGQTGRQTAHAETVREVRPGARQSLVRRGRGRPLPGLRRAVPRVSRAHPTPARRHGSLRAAGLRGPRGDRCRTVPGRLHEVPGVRAESAGEREQSTARQHGFRLPATRGSAGRRPDPAAVR